MADGQRMTVDLGEQIAEDLELVRQELGLNTTDSIRKGIKMLALMVRRRNEGQTPAFIRPDGAVQEIYFL